MENSSRDSENGGRSPNSEMRPQSDSRWTLLFIGNHGRTITLKRFKGLVMLTFLVLCLSIAITVGLLYFSLDIRNDKHQLESDLQDLKTQIKALRYEKDVLMTKLVLAESRSKVSSAVKAPPQNHAAINQQNSNTYEESRPAAPAEKPQKKTLPPKAAKPPAMKNPPASSLKVAVENFKVSPQANENLLRVQFKIKNESHNSQRVSGHAIVVLKGDPLKREKWLTIPKVPLSNGKPTGRQPGYSFGINHFKTMRFKTNLPKSLEIYQIATVFIFTKKGELLLEADFPVKLHSEPLIKASKPPSRPPSASSPASSPTSARPSSVKKVSKPPARTNSTKPAASSTPPPSPDDLMDTPKNTTAE